MSFESTFRELCYTVLNPFDSWASVIQDIYDEGIDTDLLDSEKIDNLQETEENIDPQNSQ